MMVYSNQQIYNNITTTLSGIKYINYELELNILGEDITFDFSYNENEMRILCAQLNFNGWRFWQHMKDSGLSFGPDNDKIIEKRVKILSRREKLKEIKNA
jgi:hypothetical protein